MPQGEFRTTYTPVKRVESISSLKPGTLVFHEIRPGHQGSPEGLSPFFVADRPGDVFDAVSGWRMTAATWAGQWYTIDTGAK